MLTHATGRDEEAALATEWSDGSTLLYPYPWLRDSCQCPGCWHPTSKARLLRMKTLDVEVKPADVKVSKTLQGQGQ